MGYILVITMAAYAGRRGGDEKEVEAALYVVNLKVWKIDF